MNVNTTFERLELSPLEEKLLGHFHKNLDWLLATSKTDIFLLYMGATHQAFTYPENFEQKYIYALRAVNRARDEKLHFRLTPEYEALVRSYNI